MTRNVLLVLLACLGSLPTGRSRAQAFNTLHSFAPPEYGISFAGMVLSADTLYGTTLFGGSAHSGTIFKVNTDGGGFGLLYSFIGDIDGSFPYGGLVLANGTLYGTTRIGGTAYNGNVFSIATNGTYPTTLYSFSSFNSTASVLYGTNSDGADPVAGLVLSGNTLYGTANTGGDAGNGTVFAVSTDGTTSSTLYTFTPTSACCGGTNTDGAAPWAGLTLSGSTLYGTTSLGGGSGDGTVFGLSMDGTVFTTLHSFTATSGSAATNSDGAGPQSGLVVSGSTLYGTAFSGGNGGSGTVFSVGTDGTGFTVLHTFAVLSTDSPGTNVDGANPYAGLLLSGSTLYGVASGGGSAGNGTVFSLNTDGTGFTVLHTFGPLSGGSSGTNSDGANPQGGLILSGNTLYGTTSAGGSGSYGTVFSLALPLSQPRLMIVASGQNVILSWPTNFAGFTLQSTMNPASPTFWATNSSAPVVVNGQNTVTNPISGEQQFYRLSQ